MVIDLGGKYMKLSCGWLSPSGTFVECKYFEHDAVANELVEKYYSDIDFVLIEGHKIDFPCKPDPLGVNNILEKANVSSDDAFYIGDSITDIKTAENANVDCIIVKWGYGDETAFNHEYPLKVINNFSQLYGLFDI